MKDLTPVPEEMISFEARAVAFDRDDELETEALFLAEDEQGAGRLLEVQKAFAWDEQDRRLGQDTYCLVDENQATHYGGVASWRLDANVLEINLTPDASGVFGASSYRIDLDDPCAVELVSKNLPRLVGPTQSN